VGGQQPAAAAAVHPAERDAGEGGAAVIARLVRAFTVGQCARTMVDDAMIGAVLLATAVLAFVAYVCVCLALDAWNRR
jgi:hypothetical protein